MSSLPRASDLARPRRPVDLATAYICGAMLVVWLFAVAAIAVL